MFTICLSNSKIINSITIHFIVAEANTFPSHFVGMYSRKKVKYLNNVTLPLKRTVLSKKS